MRRALALSVPFLLLSVACTYDNGDARHLAIDPSSSGIQCGTQAQATIDVADQIDQIDVDAGQGAGVYVEYAAGGHWRVRTSCDTDKDSAACDWDVLVYNEDGHTLSNFVGVDLEAGDSVHPYLDSSGTFQLNAHTSSDIDGFTFDGDPGAAVTVDALLDGTCALPYFFWLGGGALHQGSPSNPLTLTPASQ